MANRFEIVNEEDATIADYIVCVLVTDPLMLPDNLVSTCSRCFKAIQHRPHIPSGPKKVCYPCVAADIDKAQARGELDVMLSAEAAAEVRDFLRKKSSN